MFTFNLLYAVLIAAPAWAGGYSTDIELLQPGFSPGSVPGIDAPAQATPGSWSVGVLTQLEADPLVLYDSGYEIGAIIEDRVANHLGLSYAIAPRASVRLVVPSYFNSGSQTPAFSADGGGLGDVSVAARFSMLNAGPLKVGLRTELTAPTGRKTAYMGEDSLRTGAALLASLDTDFFDVLLDAGAVARSSVETDADMMFGSELVLNAGIRLSPIPERVSVFGGVLSRGGFSNFWKAESAENPVEAIGGLQLAPTDRLLLDLGGGRGITHGYGTTESRVFLGATWQIEAPDRDPRGDGVVVPETEPEPDRVNVRPIEEEEPEEDPPGGVIISGDTIQTDPIHFVFGTATITDDSLHVLDEVAVLMNNNMRIGQIVIEGHASEEGSYEYNYQLSLDRAMSVYQALYRAKVHPERMSFRPRGEVDGMQTDDESVLAADRKVEFHIVQWLVNPVLETDYQREIADPETGVQLEVEIPVITIPDAPVPDPNVIDADQFNLEDDD